MRRKHKSYDEMQQETLEATIEQNNVIFDCVLSLADVARCVESGLSSETSDPIAVSRIRRAQDELSGSEYCRAEADALHNAEPSAECFRNVLDADRDASEGLTTMNLIEVEDERASQLYDLLVELTDKLLKAYKLLQPVKDQLCDGGSVLDMARRAYVFEKFITKQYFHHLAFLNNSVQN